MFHACHLLSLSPAAEDGEDDDFRVSRILKITHGIFFLSFLFFLHFFFPHLFAHKMQFVSHDFCITAILLFTITTTNILVVHSLSPATEDGENGEYGVSNDSGEMKFPLAQMAERPLRMREVPGSIPGFSKENENIFAVHGNMLSFLFFSFC